MKAQMESMGSKRLLVLDDEPEIGEFVATVARSCRYEVRVTSNSKDFQTTYRGWQPGTIVLDLAIPEMDGVELLNFLRDEGCRSRIFLMSGMGADILAAVQRLGAAHALRITGTISKPVRAATLRAQLNVEVER